MAEPSLASVMSMMATVLERVEERDRERESRAGTERQERQAEKIIEKIPAMTDDTDLELYLQGLENEFIQANIHCDRWKSLVTPRLIPALKDHIGDLQADPSSSYQDIKDRLLDRVGQTSLQAGQQLFELRPKDICDKSSSQLLYCGNQMLCVPACDIYSTQVSCTGYTVPSLFGSVTRRFLSATMLHLWCYGTQESRVPH